MTFEPRFSHTDVTELSQHTAFDGFLKLSRKQLQHRLFNGDWSQPFERELLVKNDGAAAIVYDPLQDTIGLVDQFRSGALTSEFGPWCLEVVAGLMEPNESVEALIRRELVEEAGITDATLIPITAYYSTPGCCNEKIHLFCALADLSSAGGVHGLEHEGEDILFSVYPAEQVFAAMLNSRMNNAATLIALLWLQLNRPNLRTGNP